MIKSIITDYNGARVKGKDFSEEEKHLLSNYSFILDRKRIYSLEEALQEIGEYYNNDRVDYLINSIKDENNMKKEQPEVSNVEDLISQFKVVYMEIFKSRLQQYELQNQIDSSKNKNEINSLKLMLKDYEATALKAFDTAKDILNKANDLGTPSDVSYALSQFSKVVSEHNKAIKDLSDKSKETVISKIINTGTKKYNIENIKSGKENIEKLKNKFQASTSEFSEVLFYQDELQDQIDSFDEIILECSDMRKDLSNKATFENIKDNFPYAHAAIGYFIDKDIDPEEKLADVFNERYTRTYQGSKKYEELSNLMFNYEFSFLDNLAEINEAVKEIIKDDPNVSFEQKQFLKQETNTEISVESDEVKPPKL